ARLSWSLGRAGPWRGQPFIVAGQWQFEGGADGVVGDDNDLVDECFEHRLAGVRGAVGEHGVDVVADLGLVRGGEGLRRLVEVELQLGLTGAKFVWTGS